jgi:two-component system chemotaxis response regulator CheY
VQRPDIGRNISILRAVADDVEDRGFAHFRVMFVACRLSHPVTVSARLTNFQINRIFNASGYLPLLLGAHCGCSVMAVNTSIPILIVDDYNTMIRIIRNLLRQLGFEQIDEANDGSMALAKMRTRQYGLVISDWNMEPMTGYDLLQVVRSDPNLAETPFIMVTAESKTDNVIAAKRAGVSNYIVKPFNAQTLKSKIDAVFLNR